MKLHSMCFSATDALSMHGIHMTSPTVVDLPASCQPGACLVLMEWYLCFLPQVLKGTVKLSKWRNCKLEELTYSYYNVYRAVDREWILASTLLHNQESHFRYHIRITGVMAGPRYWTLKSTRLSSILLPLELREPE
jgi:hypothetical protein